MTRSEDYKPPEPTCQWCVHSVRCTDCCGPKNNRLYCNLEKDIDLNTWTWHTDNQVDEKGSCQKGYEPRKGVAQTTIKTMDSTGMPLNKRTKE